MKNRSRIKIAIGSAITEILSFILIDGQTDIILLCMIENVLLGYVFKRQEK